MVILTGPGKESKTGRAPKLTIVQQWVFQFPQVAVCSSAAAMETGNLKFLQAAAASCRAFAYQCELEFKDIFMAVSAKVPCHKISSGCQAGSLASTNSSYSLGHEAQGRDESSETCWGLWAEDDKRKAEEKGKVIIDVNTDSLQLMVVTLTGRTLMISVLDDWTVHDLSLRLQKDTGIPRDAFFLTHGPRVLVQGSLREMALSSSSVLRMRGVVVVVVVRTGV